MGVSAQPTDWSYIDLVCCLMLVSYPADQKTLIFKCLCNSLAVHSTVSLQSLRRRLEVCTLVAGGNGSGFLMRGAEELPEHRTPRLLDRLQQASGLCLHGLHPKLSDRMCLALSQANYAEMLTMRVYTHNLNTNPVAQSDDQKA